MGLFRQLFSYRIGIVPRTKVNRAIGNDLEVNTSQAWRPLYVAALFETDEQRMVKRIADAKKALVTRARELFLANGDHVQETTAIDEAFQALRALEHCIHVGVSRH